MIPEASLSIRRHRCSWWAVAICCSLLSSLSWAAVRADASILVEKRSDTVRVSPADVDRVAPAPTGGNRVILDDGAPRPEEGEPFVVPISDVAPEGVLGVVTDVREIDHGDDEVAEVETRPALLGRAYSEIDVEGRTLAELTPGPSVMTLLASQFDCTGSGKVDGPEIQPDLGSLELDLHIHPSQREFRLVLAGQPQIGVAISAHGEAQCHYTGHTGLPFFIPGTPILLKIAPAARAETSGDFKASFSWGPEIAVGVDKPRHRRARAVHTLSTPALEPPSFEARAHASLFLGFSLSLSVAGRIGLEGTAGPEITADLNADNASPCLTADSSVAYSLSAFTRVFFKSRKFPLKKGSFATRPLLEKGNCEPADGPVLVRSAGLDPGMRGLP